MIIFTTIFVCCMRMSNNMSDFLISRNDFSQPAGKIIMQFAIAGNMYCYFFCWDGTKILYLNFIGSWSNEAE